jgi:hypothetical protein
MKSTIIFILTALVIMSMNSCATVFSGTKSKIKIEGTPAKAYVYYNNELKGVTPMKLKVFKNELKKQPEITIKKEGYQDQMVILHRKLKGSALVGNILFTGALGLVIDFADQAIYKPEPGEINYILKKK